MKSIKSWTFLMLWLLGLPLAGQQSVTITKAEVLNRATTRNTALKIAGEAYNESQAAYRQTEAVFLPNISVSHTGITTNNPLMAFGARLNQAILTQNDFNPALLNNPDNTGNFATRLELQQPLFNPESMLQRRVAKTKMEAVALQTVRFQDYLELEVAAAYMKLQLAYETVDVLEQALMAAQSNQQLAEDNFEQGYLQRADVLAVMVRVTDVQNQLQSAKNNIQNASDYLAFLMNEDEQAIYVPADSLVKEIQVRGHHVVPEGRSDIKAMKLATEAHESLLKASKSRFLPRLNAFGSYELYGDGIFQGTADGYVLGASLSWNLFEGNQRIASVQKNQAALDKSKLEYEQYLSRSQLELSKARRSLQDAENKLRLTEQIMAQSQESLRIRTNRFKEGLEKATDLLLSEAQYAQKRLAYFQTIFEYNYAQVYLHYLTSEK